jgi:hypothetical protein
MIDVETMSVDTDTRPLSRPIAILRDGKESSLRTIGGAVNYLTSELQHLATTQEWQHAIDILGVAHSEPSAVNVDLATRLVEYVCRHQKTIKV